jgi:hypothetical protein
MILHNDKDGAVDWNQGIEYFNTLRRLRKPVVMLQYKGEMHSLRKPENRKDYAIRMREFFDHYLKGEEAPEWLEKGVAHLDLEGHLKERSSVIHPKVVQAAVKPSQGFQKIFNETDFDGWHGMGHFDPGELEELSDEDRKGKRERNMAEMRRHWRVENGEVVNDGERPYLTTDKEYGDIELRIEYKSVPKADSGVYLRTTPQVQIWDYTEEGGKWEFGADKGSGGLWNNSPRAAGKDPLVLADKPFGEWNKLRIIQVGERTTVYLNEKLVVDHARMENFWDRDKPLRRKGYIQLQTHGGEIRWRNIFLRQIAGNESNQYLADRSGTKFVSIFDGRSLDGWKGSIDHYEVVDGAMMCKPGRGGTIYFNEELRNFQVRFEFQLPPGGNNGLAIRYPGEGGAAYMGMCELQVLDNTAEKYQDLDDRQFHGSAYGMVAAKKGYLRPVGEWNYQEVTVEGSRVVVELNGTVILDADLKRVQEFMHDRPHPGKDRISGFFGFAGHSDPVKFRRIYLKER